MSLVKDINDKLLDLKDNKINGIRFYNQAEEPTDMTEGDFWYDTGEKTMKSYSNNSFELLNNKAISCTLFRDETLSGYGDNDSDWTYAEYAPLNKTSESKYSNNDVTDTSGANCYYFIAPISGMYKLTVNADVTPGDGDGDYLGLGISDEKNIFTRDDSDNQPVVNVQCFESGNESVDVIPEFYVINSGSGTDRLLSGTSTVNLTAGAKYFPVVQSFGADSTIRKMSWTFELL